MMRRRSQGRSCPLRHGDGKCEMSGEAALVDRRFEGLRWRREASEELAEAVYDEDGPVTGFGCMSLPT